MASGEMAGANAHQAMQGWPGTTLQQALASANALEPVAAGQGIGGRQAQG